MTFHLRNLILPDDYAPIAQLLNLVEPGSASAEDLEAEDRNIPTRNSLRVDENGLLAGFGRERVAAVDETGRVIGYGAAWRAPWGAPGRMSSLFCVHPDLRRQGVGGALVAHLEGWARQNGTAVLMSELKDWVPDSLPFSERRGFTQDAHVFELHLNLSQFSGKAFAGVIDDVKAGGIRFLTLADAPGEETEQKLCQLYRETLADNPGQVGGLPGFAAWREEALPKSRTRPDWVFIAADGDRFVGVSTLFSTDSPDLLYTDYTGVARSHRGRGIALALKLLSIDAARAAGAQSMYTETEAKNGPMQAVNRKLGYIPGEGAYRVIKKLS